jgi:hypothetical protein
VTVFARTDILYVGVPRTFGGCGQGHSRPVVQGAPAKVWKLDCPYCEKHLKTDSNWSGTISEIPETPDEKVVREDQEKRGKRDAEAATAQSLDKIANLPEGMATAFASAFVEAMKIMNGTAALPAAEKRCPSGHPAPQDAKFCPECGARTWKAPRVVEAAPEPQDAAPDFGPALPEMDIPTGQQPQPSGHAQKNVITGIDVPQRVQRRGDTVRISRSKKVQVDTASLGGMPLAELKALAKQLNVATKRSKADQVDAILAAVGGK